MPPASSASPAARNSPGVSLDSSARLAAAIIISCDTLVLVVFLWLASAGTWVNFPGQWHLYDELATSFRGGQLALPETPDARLLALPDPYDPVARDGVPYPQDLSLFRSRFYAYFGPVPALLLLALKVVLPGVIGDNYLVFAFVSGIFLVESALIAALRRRFFPRASTWILVPAILAAGLTNPWPWMLSTPSVYNAAIAGGVFFLMAGLAVGFHAFSKSTTSSWEFAITGVLWIAALGSRITLLLPIACVTAAAVFGLLSGRRSTSSVRIALPSLLSLFIPLTIGGAALAWYNWARFGSLTETGFRYALAAVSYREHAEIFSPLYAIQNLYNYLLNPLALRYSFPYFNLARGLSRPLIPFISLPQIYRTQEIGGLLYTAPFSLLSLIPIATLARKSHRRDDDPLTAGLRVAVIALAVLFVTSFGLYISYCWTAERFIAEFMPALFLLSTVGALQLGQGIARWRAAFTIYAAVLCALVGTSILISIFIGMSFNADAFRQLNPILWRQLSNLFRP